MASEKKTYFSITDAPGSYRLVALEVRAHEPSCPRSIVDFTLTPTNEGEKLFGNHGSFRIEFEIALKGTTRLLVNAMSDPMNVRLLGRFLPQSKLWSRTLNLPAIMSELRQWQWEIVYNPKSRQGVVFKLDSPLPKDWTEDTGYC